MALVRRSIQSTAASLRCVSLTLAAPSSSRYLSTVNYNNTNSNSLSSLSSSSTTAVSVSSSASRSFHTTEVELNAKKTRTAASGAYLYADYKGDFPRIMGKHSRLVKALYDRAVANRTVEDVEQDMNVFLNIVKLKINFFKTLYKSELSAEENAKNLRASLVQKLGLSSETAELLSHLALNKELDVVPRIAKGFLETVRHVRGEIAAVVVSAEPLSEEQKQKAQIVLDAIAKMREKKSVILTFQVDPTLIGGLRFFINDQEFFDFSVSRDIDAYEERLK